jgi:predicted MFS family arabinose efflux permease
LILLYTLAAMQFTHILDFMIVMPLGPRLMEIFKITPSQFGVIVSTYTFSAGGFGLVAAWFIDRFDRKKALLWLYAGFGLGTLACALAPSFPYLVGARFVAGGFGGVASATILALIGDAIPPNRRGAAMGTLFSSFSLASIAGVPAGLYLANHLGWHAPFFLLGSLSAIILIAAGIILPSMRDHLTKSKSKPWGDMRDILSQPNHWLAFGLTIFMTMAGFMVIPYISPYLVSNSGLSNEQLPLIYLCGGMATFFSMRWLGKLSDRIGLIKVFTVVSILAIFPILILTNLPKVSLWVALTVTTSFMILTSGRFIPGMAMVTNSVQASYRGGFMSLNSALQQFASGMAAVVSAAIIIRSDDGLLRHYSWIGILGVLSILISLVLAKRLAQKLSINKSQDRF